MWGGTKSEDQMAQGQSQLQPEPPVGEREFLLTSLEPERLADQLAPTHRHRASPTGACWVL